MYAAAADRVLVAAFVNYMPFANIAAANSSYPYRVHAGDDGAVVLEDALLAGALVDCLSDLGSTRLNDGARLAWDVRHSTATSWKAPWPSARGEAYLKELGYEEDIVAAARVDHFTLASELRATRCASKWRRRAL